MQSSAVFDPWSCMMHRDAGLFMRSGLFSLSTSFAQAWQYFTYMQGSKQ